MTTFEAAVAPTDDLRALIAGLEEELAANYPPEQRHGLPLDALFQPHIRFFIVRRDGRAVGCGGVALLDGFAELKRMYVPPQARGTGVVQALLQHLEGEARAAGLPWLRLETGPLQHAALRAYERAGFRRCGPFGDYTRMPPEATVASVFMEKPIGSTAR